MNIVVQIVTLTVLIAGAIIALCNFAVELKKQRKEEERQTKYAQQKFFAEYTKRYSEILLGLPNSVHNQQFDYNQHDKAETEKILRYMRVYFDLCSEEFYLYQSNFVDENVWENWKEGIEMALKKDAFRVAWENLYQDRQTVESLFYKDFNKEIQKIIDKINTENL